MAFNGIDKTGPNFPTPVKGGNAQLKAAEWRSNHNPK